ncbi:hypothetical protein WN944_017976 [Citrus x changshan-huyou]|uniref:Uncharacterized protein n=1 Tax=Citrus x changshan-huyou TaxID=2935761 RepID=A0AAP0QEB1_9ROSI
MYAIASSAGFEGSTVVEEILKHDNPDYGFDRTRDMIKDAIVDPLKLLGMSELDSCVR